MLATARVSTLDGNLLHIHRAMVERHPELDYVLLLEPYSYGLAGKLAYLVRLVRGMYHLQTARLFVIDNAYLPIHVAPHRPAHDRRPGLARGRARSSGSVSTRRRRWPSRSGRSCTATTTRSSSAASGRAAPYAAALRTPIERVLALGSPRTDFFFDEAALAAARARVLAAHPGARRPAGRPLRADVPRPRRRQARGTRDGRAEAAGRPARRTTRWS